MLEGVVCVRFWWSFILVFVIGWEFFGESSDIGRGFYSVVIVVGGWMVEG